MKNIKMMLVTVIIVIIAVIPVAGQEDLQKLVRITEDDSWTYDTARGDINYNVTRTFVKGLKEVNEVESNAIIPGGGVWNWNDSGFNMTITVINFTEYYSTRGNYWHGCDGDAVISLEFNSVNLTFNKSGSLWVNSGSAGSQNMAIVSGEPQLENRMFSVTGTDIWMNIHLGFLIIPSDPYLFTWKETSVSVVKLTERLNSIFITVDAADDNGSRYGYVYDWEIGEDTGGMIFKENHYVYAKDIGLPVEITRDVEAAPAGAAASTGNVERLVEYSIEDAGLDYNGNGALPFALSVPALVLVAVITIHRRKK